jgi:UDP:flavonoid glycosyltransferase YjiC (YdhE family)
MVRFRRLSEPSSVRRILLVGEAVSLAHVARPAVLARWAREAGHDVHFACGPRYAHVARSEGLEPEAIETIEPEAFYSRLARGAFFYRFGELERYVRAEVELIERVKPDLVVGDFRLTLPISAHLAGVRCLSLVNAYWSPAAPRELSAPEGGVFGAIPRFAREALFSAISPLAYRLFAAPLDRLRRSFGLGSFPDFREHYVAGDGCAYLDLPELFHRGDAETRRDQERFEAEPSASLGVSASRRSTALPVNHFFLGPVIWQPRGLPAPDLGDLGLERPLVYVTTGSSGSARRLPDMLGALLDGGWDVVLSGVDEGEQTRLRAALPALSGRALLGRFFAPERILDRARLTVCHGGSGTVYQALAAGVPVLGQPENQDQHLVTRAVEAAGAGMALDPRRLREQLAVLAGGRCRPEARWLAAAIRRHDTRGRWLTFLSLSAKEVAHGSDAHLERHLRPAARGVGQLHGERPGPA